MRHRLFILHNPNAGAAARRHYHRILALLKDLGASLECVETSRHGEGMRAAAQAAVSGRFDVIVAAGGTALFTTSQRASLGRQYPWASFPRVPQTSSRVRSVCHVHLNELPPR